MGNIKFNYLYRDGANFKSWGSVIFENPDWLTLVEVESKLTADFLPDNLFIAHQISIPEKFLFSKGIFTKNDHCYHEFDSVEICDDAPTDISGRSITAFLSDIALAAKQGWEAFEILDHV